MDNNDLLERAVLAGWREGKTSFEIKQELVAKHWQAEMVQTVIDKLVRDRVAAQEGELTALAGPDLWARPTWPVEKAGWSQKNEAPLDTSEPRAPFANPCQLEVKPAIVEQTIFEPASEITTSKVKGSIEPARAGLHIAPAALDTDETTTPAPKQEKDADLVQSTKPSSVSQVESQTALTQPMVLPLARQKQKFDWDAYAQKIAKQTKPSQKLVAKLKKNKNDESDEEIRFQALGFLGFLLVIIICALMWRFFVIK